MKLEEVVNIDKLKERVLDCGMTNILNNWRDSAIELEPTQQKCIHDLCKIYKEIPVSEISVEKVMLCLQDVLDLLHNDSVKFQLLEAEMPDLIKRQAVRISKVID